MLVITLLGASVSGSYVIVFDMVLQYNHRQNPAFVISVFEGISQAATVPFGEACRILLNYFGGFAVFVFMEVFALIALIVSVFLQPTRKNSKKTSSKEHLVEHVPLLSSEDE